MTEVISCYFLPQAAGGVPGKHQLSKGCGLMPGADGTPFYIISNVGIYAGPVDCFSDQGLHFLDPLMGTVWVSKCSVVELWRDIDMISLQENTGLYGQLVLGTPIMLDDPRDQPEAIRLSPENDLVQGTVNQVMLYGSLDSIHPMSR